MPKIWVFGLILCFCFDTALACGKNRLEVVRSDDPNHKQGDCLGKRDKLVLKNKEKCIVLKSKKCIKTTKNCVEITKKCGPYPRKNDKGFIERLIELLKQRVIADIYHCDIWDIGNMQNILFCLFKYPSNQISFYRIDINSPDSLIIMDEKDTKSHSHDDRQLDKNSFPWLLNQYLIQEGGNSFTKNKMADNIREYLNKIESDRKKLDQKCQ